MSLDPRFVDIKDTTVQKPQWRKGYMESFPIDIFMSLALLCCDHCTKKPIRALRADAHWPWPLFQHRWCLQSAPAGGHTLFGGPDILLLIVEIAAQILQLPNSWGEQRKRPKNNYVMFKSSVQCEILIFVHFLKRN